MTQLSPTPTVSKLELHRETLMALVGSRPIRDNKPNTRKATCAPSACVDCTNDIRCTMGGCPW
jgi:hypothetical protein